MTSLEIEVSPDVQAFWSVLSQHDSYTVDQQVRSAVASSLKAVYAALPESAQIEGRLSQLLHQVEREPVSPGLFGLYTDFVESVLSGNEKTRDALGESILDRNFAVGGLRIVSLTDEDLGNGQAERYARLVDDDPQHPYAIKPLTANIDDARSRVTSALQLLDEGVPELAHEMRGLVREIVLVADGGETAGFTFDGASTFYLWGAVLLNVAEANRLDLAQQIAHEAGHLLLFGLMLGQPLTENDLDEQYTSPLRKDARPMEGVVHAAYVLARMSYTLERLLASDLLSEQEKAAARADVAAHRRRYFDTLPVIEQHAKFTSEGAEAFRGALRYMRREAGSDAV
ncbi:MAG: HEXXH motif-containing putative peptide modification protein [Planctomycetota bacterium]